MRLGKKADLSLSINAIVILILAITMLGLGLAFLRGTFSKTVSSFEEVSGTVKQQITEEIKSRGEKLFIRGTPEIDVKRGSTQEVFYGIKNVLESTQTFMISEACTQAIGGGCTTTGNTTGTKVIPKCSDAVALQTLPSRDVTSGDTAVLILQVKVSPDAPADTYDCSMQVMNKAVGAAADVVPTLYQKNDFFIKVSS